MGMETVTNYTCDRCGRSEIKEGVTILTLTVRPRIGKPVPGLGKPLVSQHVCRENCLKMITAALTPVGRPGRPRSTASTKPATKPVTKPVTQTTATTGGTKKAQTARTSKIKSDSVPAPQTAPETPAETRADVVKAVRSITRTAKGGWAKGHNYRTERAMIAEREALNATK